MLKKLVSASLVVLAAGSLGYANQNQAGVASASVKHHRTAIKKVKKARYHVSAKGKKARIYTFKGSAKKLRFKTAHYLKNYTHTTFTKSKQTVVISGKKRATYYYVTGSKKVHGWVYAGYLKKGAAKKVAQKKSTKKTTKKTTPKANQQVGLTQSQGNSNGKANFATSGDVLDNYKTADFSVLGLAGNYTTGNVSYQKTAPYASSVFQDEPDTLASSKATGDQYHFQTDTYLPVTYNESGDWGNPQSATFSKDDQSLFVMYTASGSEGNNANEQGWVVKYDWAAIKNYLANNHLSMSALRRATYDHSVGKVRGADSDLLNFIHVGPTFTTGHGQSMTLNPQNDEIWFVQDTTAGNSVAERLNQASLTPDAQVKFSLKSSVGMGSVLAFDNNGQAYFWTKTSDNSWKTAPEGSVKLYEGTLSTHQVHFKLVMQGLKTAPGKLVQSMGYNPRNNRLYLVSDESITSVPVNKLGHLAQGDVDQNNFQGSREFEGLVFTHNSDNGYLLTNRGSEMMRMVH